MMCDKPDALGCFDIDATGILLRHTPLRRVRPDEDDLELTRWDVTCNSCSLRHKVLMHEAGHVFGQGHPHTLQIVMYESMSGWQDQFCEPPAHDIVGMMANYQSR